MDRLVCQLGSVAADCSPTLPSFTLNSKDHAVACARFARDILDKMRVLTNQLEVSLGPDTGDLSLRIGLNSGPGTFPARE